ncbi:unnamed protein product [Mytilus coruscus]|uniref:GDNF/GAS1 domain-containing protein n=1 Tax=Mytilus coruscus TaxID=42192 RepID=A0A6J8EP40_MYTCO|nr:unnamed protein product [Mytilus coruscus]
MNSLSLIVFFHVLSGIHGEGKVANTVNWHCKGYRRSERLFSCLYRNYHNEKDCMEIIKMTVHSAMHTNLSDECLVEQSKLPCTKSYGNKHCTKEDCRQLLSFSIKKLHNQLDQMQKDTCKKVTKYQQRKQVLMMEKEAMVTREIHKIPMITQTVVQTMKTKKGKETRMVSKKKKRKQLTRLQAINQRLDMTNLESSSSSTNKGVYNILSTNTSLNTNMARGDYFVLDPFVTKYDKDLSNRILPEIKRFSGADGDENVYYEIDEDKIESSRNMEGVYQKQIEEVRDKGSNHSDQTRYETKSGSMKKKREQLTRQHFIDQRTEIASVESIPSSTNKGGNTILSANESLNTYEAQGEYFVLDPSITKYDKDSSSRVLPEVKRFSVAHDEEKVYNEIDEDKIQSSTDMREDHQKQI